MRFLRVRNFERFQHYKDRNPVWIKLYNSVLEDYEFSLLRDATKLHLILIWLLASRHANRIPEDPQWISKKINATEPVDLDSLIKGGFLEVCEPASNVLAEPEHLARSEREIEREKSREEPTLTRPKGGNLLDSLRSIVAGLAGMRGDAKEFHDALEKALAMRGMRVVREFPVPDRGDGRGGFVDLVAFSREGAIALEMDRDSPREKSIRKLAQVEALRVVVLRDSPAPTSPPSGLDAVLSPLGGCAERREASPKRDSVLQGFDRFWAAWPSHRRKADKPRVRRKWERENLEGIAEQVIVALGRWKTSRDWRKNSGDFIPAPLVWLNQERWKVPPETLAEQVSGEPNGNGFARVFSPEMAAAAGVPYDPAEVEGGAG
jgi:hypothetical protein